MGFKENPENCNRNGRPKGTPNKVTAEANRIITKLFESIKDEDIEKIKEWFDNEKDSDGKKAILKLLAAVAPKQIDLGSVDTQNPILIALEELKGGGKAENTNISDNTDVQPKTDTGS